MNIDLPKLKDIELNTLSMMGKPSYLQEKESCDGEREFNTMIMKGKE